MTKKKTPPIKIGKFYGLMLLTFGIIGGFYLISPLLTALGVLIALPINIQIMKSWAK